MSSKKNTKWHLCFSVIFVANTDFLLRNKTRLLVSVLSSSLLLQANTTALAVPLPGTDYSTIKKLKIVPTSSREIHLTDPGEENETKEASPNSISEAAERIQTSPELKKYLSDAEEALSQKDTQRALRIFTFASSQFPKDLRPFFGQARIHFIEGQDEKALRLMNQLVAKFPLASEPYAMLGNIYMSQGKFNLASQNLKIAVKLEQGDSDSFFRLAQIVLRNGDRNESVLLLKQALQSNPHHFPARVLLARLLWSLEKFDEALLEYNSAAAQDPENAQIMSEQAAILSFKGKTLEAMEKLNQAHRIDSESAEIQKQFVTIYGDRNDWSNASDGASSWVQIEAKNPNSRLMLGWCLAMRQEFDDAAAELREAVALSPDDPEIHNLYGMVQAERKRYDDAQAQFKAAITLNPQFLPALLNTALVCMFRGQNQEALDQLKKIEAKFPDNKQVRSLHAYIACRSGRLDESRKLAEAAILENPNDLLATISLGIIARERADLEKSSNLLLRATRVAPDSVLCHIEYSKTLLKESRAKEAIAMAQLALQIAPNNLDAKAALALALAHEKNYDGPISLLKECIVRNPKDLSLRMALANVQLAKGDTEFAELTLEKAKTAFPDRAEPLLGFAEIAERAHNFKQCEKLLEDALVCAPNDLQILRRLAKLNFEQGKAEACLTQLSAINDSDLNSDDLLLKARAEFRLRDFSSAASDYNRIIHMDKLVNSQDLLNLARSLILLGQSSRAQEILGKVEADPVLLKQCKQNQIDKLQSDLKHLRLKSR